jgi:hypothetical protein
LSNNIVNIILDHAERQGKAISENFSKNLLIVVENTIEEIKYANQEDKFRLNKSLMTRSEIFYALDPGKLQSPTTAKKFRKISIPLSNRLLSL